MALARAKGFVDWPEAPFGVVTEHAEGLVAVKVVGICDAKGTVDVGLGGEHGLGGPRTWRLDREFDGEVRRPEPSDVGFYLSPDLFGDDHDGAGEPASVRGTGRIVHDGFAVWARGSELLQATEAATAAGCENDELHRSMLCGRISGPGPVARFFDGELLGDGCG
jgi:hypothetical protein